MEVAPIKGEIIVSPVTPVAPVGKVRRSEKTKRAGEPDRPIPEPEPGTGELVDLYV